jgi:hypothetical protein
MAPMATYETFEGTSVAYMLNTAGMPFFVLGNYPVYTFEDGRLVIDKSTGAKELQAEARAYRQRMRDIQSRHKRGMKIPKTWVAEMQKAASLVLAMEECRVVVKEWAEMFHRSLRYLESYQPQPQA